MDIAPHTTLDRDRAIAGEAQAHNSQHRAARGHLVAGVVPAPAAASRLKAVAPAPAAAHLFGRIALALDGSVGVVRPCRRLLG